MVQWVKNLVLSLQQLGSLLWHGFHPWPRNFHIPQAQPKKKRAKDVKMSFKKKESKLLIKA